MKLRIAESPVADVATEIDSPADPIKGSLRLPQYRACLCYYTLGEWTWLGCERFEILLEFPPRIKEAPEPEKLILHFSGVTLPGCHAGGPIRPPLLPKIVAQTKRRRGQHRSYLDEPIKLISNKPRKTQRKELILLAA